MFTPIKNKKVYEQVIEQVQEMIVSGKLNKGEKLVSERDLAEQLQVSRTSIREAIKALEIIGLVESRQGEGNYISCNIESSLFQPLSVLFMLNNGNPTEILELRMMIETGAAALAANRINDEQKVELKALMENLRNAETEEISARVDKQLHYKIAEITGNSLISSMFNAISSLMEVFIENARVVILSNYESKGMLIEQHQSICDALIDGNSELAVQKMKEHLECINSIIDELQRKTSAKK